MKKRWLRKLKAREREANRNPENTYLIVGLGNPGIRYTNSRHNLGFKAVDLFCKELNLHLSDQRFQALSISTDYHDKRTVLACPQTLMNRSGLAVRSLVEYYEPAIKDIMVVHDDIDLDVGHMKIVRGGGAGGHHGVESVIYHLGTDGFSRIKVGIGRPQHNEPIEDFVLSSLYREQEKTIEEVLHIVTKAIESFVLNGVEVAMNNFNSVIIEEKEGSS